jgi:hypothetical protein
VIRFRRQCLFGDGVKRHWLILIPVALRRSPVGASDLTDDEGLAAPADWGNGTLWLFLAARFARIQLHSGPERPRTTPTTYGHEVGSLRVGRLPVR